VPKTCVYCEQASPLTREHVVPSLLYDHVDRDVLGEIGSWNENTKSYLGGELKVKDVCATCNNGVLSELDGNGKDFLESNNLLKALYVEQVYLKYKYDLLLRWLLKIQFNADRASKTAPPPLPHLINYIRTGRNPPSPNRVLIAGELLKPHKVEGPSSPYFGKTTAEGLCNPFFVRITRTHLEPNAAREVRIDGICFGGLFLHIVYVSPDLPESLVRKVKGRVLRQNSPFMSLIDESADSVRLTASSRDFIDMGKSQIERMRVLRETGEDPYDAA
jgi:hypothetical protein